MSECIVDLKQQKVIGLDIETSRLYPKNQYDESVYKPGLDPYVSGIVMIQVGTLERQYVIDARAVDWSGLREVLEDKGIIKVGQNLSFEGRFFLHNLKCRVVNVWDCMIAEKVLYNGFRHSYSLAALMQRYLNIQPVQALNLFNTIEDDVSFDKKVQELLESSFLLGSYLSEDEAVAIVEEEILRNQYIDKSIRMGFVELGDKPLTREQIEYGISDITAPLQIYEIQKQGRVIDGVQWVPNNGFLLENAFTQVLAEASYHGVPFSKQKWLEAYESAKVLYLERLQKLNDYVEEHHVSDFCGGIDLFSGKPTCAIKWSSSTQVIKLFRKLGIAVQEKSKSTGRKEWTVGAKTLFRKLPNNLKINFYKGKDIPITDIGSLTLQYLLFKKAEQLISTFGKEWLKHVHPITNRVHTNYNQYMISSRLSSTNPNLQQIPGLDQYRQCFTGKLINCDFSAQEVRILAEVSGVKSMQDFFKYGNEVFGDDYHAFAATKIFSRIYNNPELIVRKETHPEERDKSKNTTFKLMFGGGAFTLAMDLGMDVEEAEQFIKDYMDTFEGLEENFETTKKNAVKRGWIQIDPFTDKRYFYPDFDKMNSLTTKAWALARPDYRELSRAEKDMELQRLRSETEWSFIWKEFNTLKGKLERRGLNIRIQGNAATMSKLAGLLLYNYRWSNGIQEVFKVPLYCHDEVLAEVLDGNEEKYARVIEDCMIKAGRYTCPNVPMGATAKITSYWKH